MKKKKIELIDTKGWADLANGKRRHLPADEEENDPLWNVVVDEHRALEERRHALAEQEAAQDELRKRALERQWALEKQQQALEERERAERRKRQSIELNIMNESARRLAELDQYKLFPHTPDGSYLRSIQREIQEAEEGQFFTYGTFRFDAVWAREYIEWEDEFWQSIMGDGDGDGDDDDGDDGDGDDGDLPCDRI